jgi:AcrR family transcriptional regulator
MNKAARGARASKLTVIDAALALVNRRGFAALTIRRLAADVGAPPMSLYAHFASKEQLHDLMFERLVERLFRPHGGATWQRELETACRHARSELLAHPHWLPLLTRPVLPTTALGFYDHMLRLMTKAGFPRDAAVHAFSSGISFALGFVLTERMMTPRQGVVVPLRRFALLKEAIPHFPPGKYRHITSAKSAFDEWSFDRVFDLGLRSLIAGIESEFVRSPSKAKRRHRIVGG